MNYDRLGYASRQKLDAAMRRVADNKRIAASDAARQFPDIALMAVAERRSFAAFMKQVEMRKAITSRK